MANRTIEVEIKAKAGQAKEAFRAFGLSLTDLKSGLDLAMGAARTAQQALKAVYDTAREGAVIGAVTDRFEAFAGGAENASDYLRELRKETNYTVSEMEAMTAVTKLLSMGLAEDEQSASNLAKMAIMLGDQTQSAGDRITDFALMLANQSIPRLDNYGISSGKVRARIEELMAETEGMTREQAFMNAVIEQGAIAMDTLGGEVTGNLSAYQQLESAFKNAMDAGKEWVAEGLTPAVKAAADLFTAGQRLDDMLADHQDEALQSGKAWNDYARQQITAARAAKSITGEYSDFLDDLDRALEANGVSLAERSELLADDNKVMELAIELGVGLRDQLDRTSYDAVIAGMRAATQGYSDMGMGAHNLAREMAGTTEQLITNFGDIAQAGEANKQAMSDLATVMRGELGEAWDDFTGQQEAAKAKVEELTGKIGELEGMRYLTDAQKEELAGLRGELAEANAAVEENAVAHEEATKRILFGYMEQRLGLDGLTADELQALTDVAAGWGLIDQKTYDTIVAIDAAADAFEEGKTDIANYGQELRTASGHASGLYEWLHKIPPRISVGIDITTYGAENLPPAFSPGGTPGYTGPIPNATGGDYLVTQPTLFLAGEAGPERATFTPQAGGTPNTSLPAVPMAAGGDFLVTQPTLFLAGEAGPERATFTPQGGIGGDNARAAAKLNPTLGTAQQQFENLALGIKRGSPMILDNLGLTVNLSKANADYATSIGKTVEQLTEEERKIALLHATLRAGDTLIEQAGGTVESYGDAWARAEASLKNLSDTMKAITIEDAGEAAANASIAYLNAAAGLGVDISVYGAENLPPAFSPGGTPNTSLPAVPMAAGGDFLVTQPTLFLAGEAGPERATFTPQGGIGGDNARAGMTVNIYTQQSTGSIYRDLQLVEAML